MLTTRSPAVTDLRLPLEDLRRIKELLTRCRETTQAVVKDSKEEELCAIAIDFSRCGSEGREYY